jgi:hypothetical protein
MDDCLIACPACEHPLKVGIDYLDFSDDWRLRCDVCSKELRLDHSGNLHNLGWWHWYTFTFESSAFYRLVEKHLVPCECGGSFRVGSPYRCPFCGSALSHEQILAQARWKARLVDSPRLCFQTNGRDERGNPWLRNIRRIPLENIVVPVLAILGTIGLFIRHTFGSRDKNDE